MKKDEILAKSRKENKDQDLFEKDVSQKGGNAGALVAMILATIFYVVQIFLGGGTNYGLYAVVFSVPTTGYLVKAMRMKKKKDIILAIIYILATLFFSIIHINHLITTSKII